MPSQINAELALLAKKKGFNPTTKFCLNIETKRIAVKLSTKYNSFKNYAAITNLDTLRTWLRNAHNVDIVIRPYHTDSGKMYYVDKGRREVDRMEIYPTYEQPLRLAMKEALKKIKDVELEELHLNFNL